ncbi:MAG TPA: choice-of-anchor tandem repeat GloVer-containing protein [Candidatus Cybelea sp.]|nr:choice-of-anchor tandem repeat GloVer-containing protein [Candidatus Cybelea sp.]
MRRGAALDTEYPGCHGKYQCVEKKRVAGGTDPTAGLINVSGVLYGVAFNGGGLDIEACTFRGWACGTVFKLTTSGKFTVLHRFGNLPDGYGPMGRLTNVDGTLYGTTEAGGGGQCKLNNTVTTGCGTVFEVSTSGLESVIYRFKGQPDGLFPTAGLTRLGTALYGTTSGGGAKCSGCGTVFKVTTSGKETVLHSFKATAQSPSGKSDGASPAAGLAYANGKLYGTTEYGGGSNEGTVFAITTSGNESVLHSFAGGPADGEKPDSALIKVNGTFYGTTSLGGTYNLGTVFAIAPSGKVTILHSFNGSGDGSRPTAGLVDVGDTLYGTTQEGSPNQAGTAFAITTSGAYELLHCFYSSVDGGEPRGDLIDVDGRLFGTTSEGGPSDSDGSSDGTVFSLTTDGEATLVHAFGGPPRLRPSSTACRPDRPFTGAIKEASS